MQIIIGLRTTQATGMIWFDNLRSVVSIKEWQPDISKKYICLLCELFTQRNNFLK